MDAPAELDCASTSDSPGTLVHFYMPIPGNSAANLPTFHVWRLQVV
jgi:hypothetical protein